MPAVPPDPTIRTNKGIIIDCSKDQQRLITPWGFWPISYTMSFNGYNEEKRADKPGLCLLRSHWLRARRARTESEHRHPTFQGLHGVGSG